MFAAPLADAPITQADIFDDCPLVGLDAQGSQSDLPSVPVKRWLSRMVVLDSTSAILPCAGKRRHQSGTLPVHEAQKLVDGGVLKGTVIRDQLRRHLVFGWYFVPAATAPVALPESLVDLRDVHSVPRVILEHLVGVGKRPSVGLASADIGSSSPRHFAVTYMRVALPEPYPTQPCLISFPPPRRRIFENPAEPR